MVKKITRTVDTTIATVSYVDIHNETVESATFELAGTFKTDKAILRACQKTLGDVKDKRVLNLTDSTVESKKYAMTLEDFIENATEITE